MTYLAIAIGAVVGANTRFLLGGWIAGRLGTSLPYGTLSLVQSGAILAAFVNVSASVAAAPAGVYAGTALARLV